MLSTVLREKLVCECGRTGYLKLREDAQPLSGTWESYSLEGFEGSSLTITSSGNISGDKLAYLHPLCPQCSQWGKVKYASRA